MIVVCLSVFTQFTETERAEAGPFQDFFRALSSSMPHPEQKIRSHRSNRKQHNEAPPSDASNGQTLENSPPAPPNGHNIRVAKSTAASENEKSGLPYATPVPGKQGLVTSPFSPDSGYIDVHGFSPGTAVEDPYTGKVFLTP